MRLKSSYGLWACLSLASIIGLLGAIAPRLRPRMAGPARVHVDRLAHNWGHVEPGTRLATEFVITNQGGRTLRFGDVSASCGCARPVLPAKALGAGEQMTLKIDVNASADIGNQLVQVSIETLDPYPSTIGLHLYYTSWRGIQAKPEVIDLGRVHIAESAQSSVQLFSFNRRAFRILGVACSSDALQASVDRDVRRPVHRMELKFAAGSRAGHIRDYVTVSTDLEDTPRIVVPVVAQVVGLVSVGPSTIYIATEDIDNVINRHILVKAEKSDTPLVLKDVKLSAPLELVSHKVVRKSAQLLGVDLTLRLPGDKNIPTLEVVLEVGTPDLMTIRVPVTVQGRSRPLPLGEPGG